MNYEKKYKEALELARVAAFNGHQSLMEGIFPELKESEDERMKNAAIRACKYMIDNFENSTKDYEDAIAWLEKQKSITDDEFEQGKEDVLWCIKQAKKNAKDENEMGTCWFAEKWLEKQGTPYTKRDVDDAFVEGMALAKDELEKQGGQNPQRMVSAEAKEAMYDKPACVWSEVDERTLKGIIGFISHGQHYGVSNSEMLNWLKSLKQRIGG